MARLSGLQRDVLDLYRQCFRAIKTKPAETRDRWRNYVRQEFARGKTVPKKLFSVVEHLLRIGHKRYDTYLNPQIKDIH